MAITQVLIALLAWIVVGANILLMTGLFVLIIDSPRVPTLLFFVFGTLSGGKSLIRDEDDEPLTERHHVDAAPRAHDAA